MSKTYEEVRKIWEEQMDLETAQDIDPNDEYCWDSVALGFGIAHGLEGDELDEFVAYSAGAFS